MVFRFFVDQILKIQNKFIYNLLKNLNHLKIPINFDNKCGFRYLTARLSTLIDFNRTPLKRQT